MISYSNHTQKALLKQMVAPLETKHTSFFSPRISRVILPSSFLTPASFTPSFIFQQPEKDIFLFFFVASFYSKLSIPLSQPTKMSFLSCSPFFCSILSPPFRRLCLPFLKQLTIGCFSSYFPSYLVGQEQLTYQLSFFHFQSSSSWLLNNSSFSS